MYCKLFLRVPYVASVNTRQPSSFLCQNVVRVCIDTFDNTIELITEFLMFSYFSYIFYYGFLINMYAIGAACERA